MAHSSRTFSGQQQRVAKRLMGDPAIVLADEPTGNLDSETSEEIMDLIHQLNEGAAPSWSSLTMENSWSLPGVVTLLDGVVKSDSRTL